MSSKLFLDSSILVEWARKTQTVLFDHLVDDNSYELCINQIVLSEFTYYWLAIGGGKASVTLKRDGAISSVLKLYNPISLLKKVTWLNADQSIIPLYLRLMEEYNLLPNDALILATCKLNGVNQLASYDADFEAACVGEKIQLVKQISDLS